MLDWVDIRVGDGEDIRLLFGKDVELGVEDNPRVDEWGLSRMLDWVDIRVGDGEDIRL